jgi:hypothetical protein
MTGCIKINPLFKIQDKNKDNLYRINLIYRIKQETVYAPILLLIVKWLMTYPQALKMKKNNHWKIKLINLIKILNIRINPLKTKIDFIWKNI